MAAAAAAPPVPPGANSCMPAGCLRAAEEAVLAARAGASVLGSRCGCCLTLLLKPLVSVAIVAAAAADEDDTVRR